MEDVKQFGSTIAAMLMLNVHSLMDNINGALVLGMNVLGFCILCYNLYRIIRIHIRKNRLSKEEDEKQP